MFTNFFFVAGTNVSVHVVKRLLKYRLVKMSRPQSKWMYGKELKNMSQENVKSVLKKEKIIEFEWE